MERCLSEPFQKTVGTIPEDPNVHDGESYHPSEEILAPNSGSIHPDETESVFAVRENQRVSHALSILQNIASQAPAIPYFIEAAELALGIWNAVQVHYIVILIDLHLTMFPFHRAPAMPNLLC